MNEQSHDVPVDQLDIETAIEELFGFDTWDVFDPPDDDEEEAA
jgi:hypothetical protein